MAHQQFVVSDNNPNDTHGGGGCVCDPLKQIDCKPPYIVITDNFLEDPRSPMVVVCQACVHGFAKALEGEALSVGEKNDQIEILPPPSDEPELLIRADDEEVPEV